MKPKGYWLASYPKSGNTWVRLFLQAYQTGICDINFIPSTVGDSKEAHYLSVAGTDIKNLHPQLLWLYRNAVLLNLVASPYVLPVIIKTHMKNANVGGFDFIPKWLTAGGVYLVRDPRDVCGSFSRHMGMSIDMSIAQMSQENSILHDDRDGRPPTFLGSWSDHVKSWENFTVVRYEDLLSNPEDVFSIILEAFKIGVKKQRLRKAIRLTELERLKQLEERDGFLERQKSAKFFGEGKGFKTDLSDKQIRRIEEDHSEVMKKYGYEPYKKTQKLRSVQ